jgi:hypothetical protein
MEIIYLIKLNINLKIHLELNKFFLLLEYIKKNEYRNLGANSKHS